MIRFPHDDSQNIASRIARLDTIRGSKLIGIIKSIRYYDSFFILELESGSYYKFINPRGLKTESDVNSVIQSESNLFLILASTYVYITYSSIRNNWKDCFLFDGESIEEIKPKHVLETLIDSLD